MSSIEKKLSAAILRAMWSRDQRRRLASLAPIPASLAPAELREATFSDFDGVMELRSTVGWPRDSIENWERLWRYNPALASMRAKTPMGWVLETQNRVVGYLGNIPLTYHFGDRTLSAVAGSNMVVEPAYRGLTLSLNAAFYRQQTVDLYLTTTAIESVGKIAGAFKAASLPQPDYDYVFFWVLRPELFAGVLMKKLNVRPPWSKVAGKVAALAIKVDRGLWHRWPSEDREALTVKDISVGEIGEEFRVLWMQKLKEGERLVADRDPATLRWHFEIPHDQGSSRVLCCYKGAELLGYAVVRHEPPGPRTGLRTSLIADMLVKEDNPVVLKSLWVAAYNHAKQAGSHIFEVVGFPPSIRRICSPWRPYVRQYAAFPFYYKAADSTLHKALTNGELWYASAYDGDTSLWGFTTAS
jgi:hypothetical protein